MKNTLQAKTKGRRADEARPEYSLDYAKARPNRFAGATRPGAVAMLLDPDVARYFRTAESVNAVLRALMTTMPARRAPAAR